MNLFLDIETTPTARQDVRDYLAASVSHPGNISKPESIAKWNEECRPAVIEEAVARTGLDGAFGQVCVIGWAVDDGEPEWVSHESDEQWQLAEFARRLNVPANERHTTTIVGHNVSSFDLRFLTQRFIVNGIRPPMVIARAAQAKPWEAEKVFDTMVQWAGVGNRISLDKLCLALSIPSPKGDMDGSMVGEYVRAGRIKEVVEYCLRDVAAARNAWRRMTFSAATVAIEQFDDVPA